MQSDNTQSAPPPEEKTAESAEVNSSLDASEEISADADAQRAQEEKPARPKTERKVARTRTAKPKTPTVDSETTAEEEKQAEEHTAASPAEEEIAVASVQALEDEAEQPAEDDGAEIEKSDEEKPKEESFDKGKILKYFKRHPKMTINTKVDRFTPELNNGLSPEQVETRFKQFLFNDTNKKYSKSQAYSLATSARFSTCCALSHLSRFCLRVCRA